MGRPIRSGVEIQYVICRIPDDNEDDDLNNQGSKRNRTVAEKAYHPEEVTKQNLKVNFILNKFEL